MIVPPLPPGQQVATLGLPATLPAPTVLGATPLNYQWQQNGILLPH